MAVTPKTKTQTVAAALVDALKELGVRYVFGVPSGGWVDYMDALRQADGIEFVLTTHEGAAGMMADVCGRLGPAPGVCFGTFGPGATNLATGVGGALLDRSPMIALTDERQQRPRRAVRTTNACGTPFRCPFVGSARAFRSIRGRALALPRERLARAQTQRPAV